MIKWTEGRQGSGYFKFKIFKSKLLKMDIYLLKFPEGSYIDLHTDPVEGHKHHRLNVILKKADKGGQFSSTPRGWQNMYPTMGRIIKFRPDLEKHMVSKVILGTRYVLSIGWLTRRK
jgi:hypothetical protein